MEAEPDGEVQDDADDGGRDGGEGGVSFSLPRSCSMCGAPRKIQRKHGMNVVHVVMNASSVAESSGGSAPG